MRILAIESSEVVASVAIATDDVLNAEYTINNKTTHSQTLLPMIDEVTKQLELDKETIDAVAISGGPGSYTGLRIGSATAKGIGLALDIPIINVPTMDALAYNMFSSSYIVCPIMDARRNQVYTGVYQFDGTEMKTIIPQCVKMIDEIIYELDKIGMPVMFLGNGVQVQREKIDETLAVEHYYAPVSMNRAKASSLAALAFKYYKEGKVESASEHKPDYLRLSQAERELKEKMAKKND